ncbi:hypothetical protein [Pedobacter sp.]|uniref:hypothetical protein n=1 Tax=Pedobacter sp. TaxID=1411316 RepID=UPI003BA92904
MKILFVIAYLLFTQTISKKIAVKAVRDRTNRQGYSFSKYFKQHFKLYLPEAVNYSGNVLALVKTTS